MFTGLIQATGTLKSLTSHQVVITYVDRTLPPAFTDLEIGDSVAVDGACLTVAALQPHGFVADVSPETLARTTLSTAIAQGSWVNLETSLRLGSKMGGHVVTGHIDGLGYLESAQATATSWQLDFHIPVDSPVCVYIVPKGSLAVNGVSLTIADCNPEGTQITLAVIPHTYQVTNLHSLKPGQAVNLEADILGKYVAKLLTTQHLHRETSAWPDKPNATADGIDMHFLSEHGYL